MKFVCVGLQHRRRVVLRVDAEGDQLHVGVA